MIYFYLMGGLGNQMFQIATGLSYAIENGVPVYFSEKTNLGINATERFDYEKSIFETVPRISEPTHFELYREPDFLYHKIPSMRETRIRGYFQSERYFMQHKEAILKKFNACLFKEKVRKSVDENLAKIDHKKTISVHVRRQDYVHLQHVHHLQDEKYYEDALNKIGESLRISVNELKDTHKLVIFSDDMEWCKNLDLFKRFHCYFMPENEDYVDLYTMSLCTHHIIANSSFSWWGAYLNGNPKKIVVAPSKWFGPEGPSKWDTIYCDDWKVV